MKVFFKTILAIIFVAILGIGAYYAHLFYTFENPNIVIVQKIRDKEKEISNIEKEIAKTKEEIKDIIDNNQETYEELDNWQRHKEKLEKILVQ